ncbi:hypothetical protein [Nocardia sp. NBC_01009]|uniref:hypothetical protein n=1 Tax=Nocardia sp. NBC_01009 TaxID=2975996 RepID=UPI0038655310|nr:hypothetical protein OHA42_17850 [Nocardia sp. NBC_01009]
MQAAYRLAQRVHARVPPETYRLVVLKRLHRPHRSKNTPEQFAHTTSSVSVRLWGLVRARHDTHAVQPVTQRGHS